MSGYGRVRRIFSFTRTATGIVRENFALIGEMFSGDADAERRQEVHTAFQSLVSPMLMRDGHLSESRKTVYRRLLEEQFDRAETEHCLRELERFTPLPESEAIRVLCAAGAPQARKIAEFLLALALALGNDPADAAIARRLAAAIAWPEEEFSALHRQLSDEYERRKRLIRSGHGVIAALVIIAVFILTAKLLQSVIFGLILGCILLPLEKFLERRLRRRRGAVYLLTAGFGFVLAPLRKLSRAITRRDTHAVIPTDAEMEHDRRIIRQAVTLTTAIALLVAGAAGWGVTKLTGRYMKNVQKRVQVWETNRNREQHMLDRHSAIARTNYYLEKLRKHFEELPPVRAGLDFLGQVINDPEARTKFLETVLKHSGGIFYFTTGMVGMVISLLCNILLTVFFALLFLIKLAEFCRDDGSDKRKSEYLVRSFFNGIWLPGADENVIAEAGRIIEGILFRLRVWLKGYLTLILIDSTVYTTSFFFLGVPFFLPLGLLAGCGIALPYLGPVISCAVTVLVTLASGDASGNMLAAIIVCYLIYNGVIEQFILYPAVIGEALGLSTLETIIVVLLGAVFAGIPGMIFALPAASVAKYIIPQIYRGFVREEARGNL